jgi:hypothetical protein
MHECEECGRMCNCDEDDMRNPAPVDCTHECPVDDDELEDHDEDEDDEGGWPGARYSGDIWEDNNG